MLEAQRLWMIGALTEIGFSVLVLLVRKGYPERLSRALLYWAASCVSLGVIFAMGAVLSAGISPSQAGLAAAQILGGTLATLAMSLKYQAVTELKQQQPSKLIFFGPPLLTLVLSIWFTLVARNLTVRQILWNAANLAVMIAIIRSLARAEEGDRPLVDKLTMVVYSLLALATFLVIVDFLRRGQFPQEYAFNQPRALFNIFAAITAAGIISPSFLLMVSDRLNRTLKFQAMRDPLTHLYNRRAFEEIASSEISGAARSGAPVSVLIVDVNHFIRFNDELGHLAGDAALVAVAASLRSSLRTEDFLCRWGGDEFCALLPRSGITEAQAAAQRTTENVSQLKFFAEDKPVKIEISVGTATGGNNAEDLAFLMKQADDAMYLDKQAGRR